MPSPLVGDGNLQPSGRLPRLSPVQRGHPEAASRSLPKPLQGDYYSGGSHKPTQEPPGLVSDLRFEFCLQVGKIGFCCQVAKLSAELCLQRGYSFLCRNHDSFLRASPENTTVNAVVLKQVSQRVASIALRMSVVGTGAAPDPIRRLGGMGRSCPLPASERSGQSKQTACAS